MGWYQGMDQVLTIWEITDAFTINAVAQDDFSDVQVLDAPEQPPHTPHTGVLKTPPEVAGGH